MSHTRPVAQLNRHNNGRPQLQLMPRGLAENWIFAATLNSPDVSFLQFNFSPRFKNSSRLARVVAGNWPMMQESEGIDIGMSARRNRNLITFFKSDTAAATCHLSQQELRRGR